MRSVINPLLPVANGKIIQNADVEEPWLVFECSSRRFAAARSTTYDKKGKTLYVYIWGSPAHLDLATGGLVKEGSTTDNLRSLTCDEGLRKPLVTETDLAEMNFASLTSTPAEDGEIFYGPLLEVTNERTLVIKPNQDVPLSSLAKKHILSIGVLGTFRYVVQKINMECSSSSYSNSKEEYYDDKFDRVQVLAYDVPPEAILPGSAVALLKRIACAESDAGSP